MSETETKATGLPGDPAPVRVLAMNRDGHPTEIEVGGVRVKADDWCGRPFLSSCYGSPWMLETSDVPVEVLEEATRLSRQPPGTLRSLWVGTERWTLENGAGLVAIAREVRRFRVAADGSLAEVAR